MPTQNIHSSHLRSAVQINSLVYKLTKIQQLPNAPIHQPRNSSTQKIINSSTNQLKNLNIYLLFYNIALIFASF